MKIIITEGRLNSVVLNWLDNEFGNLTKLVKNNSIRYVNQDGLPLFYYYLDDSNKIVYINHKRIWSLLWSIFGMEQEQIREILKIWLKKTYNLRGYAPITIAH